MVAALSAVGLTMGRTLPPIRALSAVGQQGQWKEHCKPGEVVAAILKYGKIYSPLDHSVDLYELLGLRLKCLLFCMVIILYTYLSSYSSVQLLQRKRECCSDGSYRGFKPENKSNNIIFNYTPLE